MKILDFFLFLWVIFALLDPDPATQINPDTEPCLHASTVSIHGPPRLHFEPLRLLNFDLNADPDPASQNNAEPY